MRFFGYFPVFLPGTRESRSRSRQFVCARQWVKASARSNIFECDPLEIAIRRRRTRLHRQISAHRELTDGSLMDDSELSSPARGTARIDPRLLEVLVCPVTRATLSYDSERQELISRAAKLAYPIRDGVPIMLPEEARPLED
jgi:uncharacterized protein YbaR (Trm112 family)